MTESSPTTIPDDLVAVALDTNAMPGGHLDIKSLEQLSAALEQQGLDVEIWVPEPVLWEWAEHLHAGLAKGRRAYQAALRAAKTAGFTGLPDVLLEGLDIDQTVDRLTNALNGILCVTILRLEDFPDAAISGLRDQLLLTGPAKKKGGTAEDSGVKTGAADSASASLIRHAALDELANIVLVSADRDMVRCFEPDNSPLLIANLFEVKRAILALATGTYTATLAVRAAVEELLEELSVLGPHIIPFEVRRDITSGDLNSDTDYFDIDYEVDRLDLDELGEIEVSRIDRLATVEAKVLVDVSVAAAFYNEYAEQVDHTYLSLPGVPAKLEMSAQLFDRWLVTIDRLAVE